MPRKVFVAVLMLWPLAGSAQSHPSLDAVLKLAKEHAYTAQYVQWANVETKADGIASNKSEDEAIRFVLKRLGDGHSFYVPPHGPTTSQANSDPAKAAGSLSEVKEPVEGIPIIEVRGWAGSPAEGAAAALSLRSQVVTALTGEHCGLVLDFSGNTGGNMWPMLFGLSPLLSEGVLGYFQDATDAVRPVEKHGGIFSVGGKPQLFGSLPGAVPAVVANRVAVVVGPRSASSGEIVPIMFHGQTNVRLFGRPSSGHSTSNSTFHLPNGGFANITTATTLDRNRVEFGERIVPEEVSEQPIDQATRWITSGCHGK